MYRLTTKVQALDFEKITIDKKISIEIYKFYCHFLQNHVYLILDQLEFEQVA